MPYFQGRLLPWGIHHQNVLFQWPPICFSSEIEMCFDVYRTACWMENVKGAPRLKCRVVKKGNSASQNRGFFFKKINSDDPKGWFWIAFIVPTTHETARHFPHNDHNHRFIFQYIEVTCCGQQRFHMELLKWTQLHSGQSMCQISLRMFPRHSFSVFS